MPLINTAAKLYTGGTLAKKVYRGTVQVWPPAAAWGPPQSAYTTQIPPAGVFSLNSICAGNDFTFAVAGRITGMRHWRHATATRPAARMRLWSSPTTSAGVCDTSGSTGSGWKAASFATPIPVTAGQTFRATVAPDATAGVDNMTRTPSTGDVVNGDVRLVNQTYTGATNLYPTTTSTNTYWVDVIFEKSM